MTVSIFRSKWSFGTSASMSTMTGAFRESFFQFSILLPPCSYYTRRTSPPARFFDKLKRTTAFGGRSFIRAGEAREERPDRAESVRNPGAGRPTGLWTSGHRSRATLRRQSASAGVTRSSLESKLSMEMPNTREIAFRGSIPGAPQSDSHLLTGMRET